MGPVLWEGQSSIQLGPSGTFYPRGPRETELEPKQVQEKLGGGVDMPGKDVLTPHRLGTSAPPHAQLAQWGSVAQSRSLGALSGARAASAPARP